MDFFQSGLHLFTERPELFVRSVQNEFTTKERQHNFLEENCEGYFCRHEEETPSIIVQYPKAVSRFDDYGFLAPEYEVAVYSKRRKAPALVVWYSCQKPEINEHLYLSWGVSGECISQIQIEAPLGKISQIDAKGIDKLDAQLAQLFPDKCFWAQLLLKSCLQEIINELGKELGIFICGKGFEKFLEHQCALKKRMMFGSVYKANGKYSPDI